MFESVSGTHNNNGHGSCLSRLRKKFKKLKSILVRKNNSLFSGILKKGVIFAD